MCIRDSTRTVSEQSTEQRYRKLYLDNVEQQVRCVSRDSLKPADKAVNGPLIIEENYTVLLLGTGWCAHVLDDGDLLCERPGAGTA